MATISEAIRDAIDASGLTLYRVAKDTGINYATVYRFYYGQRRARLEAVERLAEYLELELKPKQRG